MLPVPEAGGAADRPAGAPAPAGPAAFRYTLVDYDGRPVGGYITPKPLQTDDVVAASGLRWRVVGVVGALATVTQPGSE